MKKLITFMTALICGVCFAGEGTVSTTWRWFGVVRRCDVVWAASTNGVVDAAELGYFRGQILRMVLSHGATAEDGYDVTLTDENGIDVLAGLGTNVSTSTVLNCSPVYVTTSATATNIVLFAVNDVLTLNISNAGTNNATGKIVIYLQ